MTTPRALSSTMTEDRLGPALAAAGLAAAGFALGVVLTAASVRIGSDTAPAILLGLALAPALATAVIVYPPLAVMLVFASFPVGTTDLPGGRLEVVEATVLMMAALVVLRRLATGRVPLPWFPELWWAVALLGWMVVSLAYALDQALAVKQIAALAGGVVFALVVPAACRTLAELRRVLLVFVLIAAGITAYALGTAESLSASYGGSIVEGRLTGTFVHPNELGAFCAMGALVAAGLALGGRSRGGRFLAGAAMLVLLAGLTLSFARGAWIGLALGLVYLLWAVPRARRAAVVIGVPLVVVAALAGSFSTAGQTQIQVVGERVGAITTTSPYDHRQEIWSEAVREIRAEPWTGTGPGNFPVSSARAASGISTVYAEHAHNLALTWAAESGLLALLLIGGFVAALGLAASRASRAARLLGDARDRALVAGIVAALIAVLGQGLVDYTLRNAIIFLAVWALVGALLTARRELVGAAAESTPPRRSDGRRRSTAPARERTPDPNRP